MPYVLGHEYLQFAISCYHTGSDVHFPLFTQVARRGAFPSASWPWRRVTSKGRGALAGNVPLASGRALLQLEWRIASTYRSSSTVPSSSVKNGSPRTEQVLWLSGLHSSRREELPSRTFSALKNWTMHPLLQGCVDCPSVQMRDLGKERAQQWMRVTGKRDYVTKNGLNSVPLTRPLATEA